MSDAIRLPDKSITLARLIAKRDELIEAIARDLPRILDQIEAQRQAIANPPAINTSPRRVRLIRPEKWRKI